MKIAAKFLTSLLVFAVVSICAADKIAIAEPVAKGGVDPKSIEAFWGILETTFNSSEYKLISREALKQMMTEIGLTTSSGLVNLNSAQKAKLGELKTVKYILVSEIGRFGSKLNCTFRIIDASTGEIDTARSINMRVNNLDELVERVDSGISRMMSNEKRLMRSAVLYPVVKVTPVPEYLVQDFNVRMENGLLENGVRLQNLQSVAKILRRNGIDELFEVEPKTYAMIGKLLEVRNLIQASITRFEIASIPYHVSETGAKGFRYIGYFEGSVSIISAQSGELITSVPFESRINFRSLSRRETRDWTIKDYGKHMIKTVMREQIVPAILKSRFLKDR